MKRASILICGDKARVKYSKHPSSENGKTIQPYFDKDSRYCCIAVGKLYPYTSNIYDLNNEPAEVFSTNLARVILNSYTNFGINGLADVNGCWSCSILDIECRTLLLARDSYGTFPFYYRIKCSKIVASTDIRLLLYGESTVLSKDFICEYLCATHGTYDSLSNYTPYKNIDKLKPGEVMTYDLDSENIISRHSILSNLNSSLPYKGEIHPSKKTLVEILDNSLCKRLGQNSAIHLSGGIDSSLLCALANNSQKNRGKGSSIIALSNAYRCHKIYSRESEYIDFFLRQYSELIKIEVELDNFHDFDPIPSGYCPDEPFRSIIKARINLLTATAVSNSGSDVVITGYGADEILEQYPWDLLHFLAKIKFSRFWSDSIKWAKLHNVNVWKIYNDYLLSPVANNLRLKLVKILMKINCQLSIFFLHPHWFSSSLVAKHSQAQVHYFDTIFNSNDLNTNYYANTLHGLRSDKNRLMIFDQTGIWTEHPYIDHSFISSVFRNNFQDRSVPSFQKEQITKLISDLLPNEIISRKHKINYNEIYFTSICKNRLYLISLVRKYSDVLSEFINPNLLVDFIKNPPLLNSHSWMYAYFDNVASLLIWLELRSTETAHRRSFGCVNVHEVKFSSYL